MDNQFPPHVNRYRVPLWADHGVRASSEAWQHFRQLLLDAAVQPPGESAQSGRLKKSELASAAWETGLARYPKSTIDNWLAKQKPRDDVLVSVIQAFCLGWVKRAPRAVATEEVIRLVAHLGGMTRALARSGIGRPNIPHIGALLPVNVEHDVRHDIRAGLISAIERKSTRLLVTLGGDTQAWLDQMALLFEQDVVHETFAAFVIFARVRRLDAGSTSGAERGAIKQWPTSAPDRMGRR